MLQRVSSRHAFGKALAQQGMVQADIAASRIDIEAARLLVLACAAQVHAKGGRAARKSVAIIKVFVPAAVHRVCDRAVQAFGGAGLCQDTPLAALLAGMRSLRLADGPDAVHVRTVALLELKDHMSSPKM
jgi:acyl-CoA dehydrogenase